MTIDQTILPEPQKARLLPAAVALLFVAFMGGCDESLPPRIPPPTVLRQSLNVLLPTSIGVHDSLPAGLGGAFEARVLNLYDDVLQDTARVRLTLEIFFDDDPTQRAHVQADEADVTTWRLLQRGVLTMGVDTAVVIQKQWSHRTDAGVPFWSLVTLTPMVTLGGTPYLQSDPVRLTIQGTVQVFKVIQPLVIPPQKVELLYKIF
jgi:hypothetical protein